MRYLALVLAFVLGAEVSRAQSVGKTAEDNSVAAQLASFRVHPDFEVSLFADESLGIANPIAMHWDERGRLWVLTTLTYAQLEPGEKPDDTLVILEDTDGDGRADTSTVFASGLDMPMGFALYEDGAFVGAGPDLLLLRDTDDDGKADSREVVLTGFGTGDTHQNISNFTWGPDGRLWFAQGLHCYSLVETPFGIERGDAAGFWRFDPETLRLEPFCFPSNCAQNPCGIVFDKTGALFIKSNNRELIYATPGLVPTTRQKDLVPVGSIGSTPGKSMGGEYVHAAGLPEWIQDHILIAGYYAHRVSAFPLVREGAGYAVVEPVEILASDHVSFRPVEIRVGPDGGIYVADWFNPIIGHYQASLRHPDRDEEHGRIWRVAARAEVRTVEEVEPLPGRMSLFPEKLNFDDPSWASMENPRGRLHDVLGAANSGKADALPAALRALDHPRDRFIDYALEQTVHALADHWVPAVEAGGVEFFQPEHLAYALETLGGEDSLRIARAMRSRPGMSSESRSRLGLVIARLGGSEDHLSLLREGGADPALVEAIAVAADNRKLQAPEGAADLLRQLIASNDPHLRTASMQLAGAWRVAALGGLIREEVSNPQSEDWIRAAAVRSLGALEKGASAEFLAGVFSESRPEVQVAILESLVSTAPKRAVDLVSDRLVVVASPDEARRWLGPFLTRKGVTDVLAERLRAIELSAEAATHASSALSAMGQGENPLLGVFQDAMGISAGARAYSPDFVAEFVAELAQGDAEKGKGIYARAELTCAACHQIGGVGGVIGPSLDAVGAGLSPDLLVESVLWPQRQMKEGYFAVAVTTKSGETFSGYREKEEGGVFHLRDTATGAVREIPRVEISRIDQIGSLMPAGLTNSLSREELRDLIAFLVTLKG